MKISEAIAQLRNILEYGPGDIELVSGLGRSGYGEPVTILKVVEAKAFGTNQLVEVVDAVLRDESIVYFSRCVKTGPDNPAKDTGQGTKP